MDNIEKQYQFFQYEGIRKSAYGIGYADLKEECDKHEQERRRFLAENRTYTDTFDKEETLRFICYYKVIDTVEKINKGVRIVNINWFSVVYRGFYDLKILCWVVNSFDDINVKTAIVDEVHRQLLLHLKTNDNDNAECFIEYLKSYKEMLISDATYIPPAPQQPEQKQIYCIPTNLSEEQLKNIFIKLKQEMFIATEQTEEDFLNAFNPNAAKQGKIKWVKIPTRGKRLSPTQIVHFCNLMAGGNWLAKQQNTFVVELLSAVFGVSTNIKRISSAKKEKTTEYNTELQSYINIARNSAKR